MNGIVSKNDINSFYAACIQKAIKKGCDVFYPEFKPEDYKGLNKY